MRIVLLFFAHLIHLTIKYDFSTTSSQHLNCVMMTLG
jgi:hypothetical protein